MSQAIRLERCRSTGRDHVVAPKGGFAGSPTTLAPPDDLSRRPAKLSQLFTGSAMADFSQANR
jgi:hypothetical protein